MGGGNQSHGLVLGAELARSECVSHTAVQTRGPDSLFPTRLPWLGGAEHWQSGDIQGFRLFPDGIKQSLVGIPSLFPKKPGSLPLVQVIGYIRNDYAEGGLDTQDERGARAHGSTAEGRSGAANC